MLLVILSKEMLLQIWILIQNYIPNKKPLKPKLIRFTQEIVMEFLSCKLLGLVFLLFLANWQVLHWKSFISPCIFKKLKSNFKILIIILVKPRQLFHAEPVLYAVNASIVSAILHFLSNLVMLLLSLFYELILEQLAFTTTNYFFLVQRLFHLTGIIRTHCRGESAT